ncbi:Ig-like domain-containing protein [Vibrio harveyi]
MTQLFRTDEACEFFYGITLEAKQRVIVDELVKMNSEIVGSKSFGYLLYDNNTFPVLTGLDRDFFAENYMGILKAMQTAGTYDSYIIVIEQVVGDGVGIEFTVPKPRVLSINIFNVESYTTKLITPSNLWITTPSNYGLLVPKPVSNFELSQLVKILKILANPTGTYLDISFHERLLPSEVIISGAPTTPIEIGDTGRLTAKVSFNDGTSVETTDKPDAVVWESSDSLLLTIDKNGNYEAIASGSVSITATATSDDPYYNDDVLDRVSVTVASGVVLPYSIELTRAPSEPISAGTNDYMLAEIIYTDNTVVSSIDDPDSFKWTSSDSDIVDVFSDGSYSAIAEGDASITVLALSDEPSYDDDVFTSVDVAVTPPPPPPPPTFDYTWTTPCAPTPPQTRDFKPSPNQPFDGTNYAALSSFYPQTWFDGSDISQMSMDGETDTIRFGATDDSKWGRSYDIRVVIWSPVDEKQKIDTVLNWQGTCYEVAYPHLSSWMNSVACSAVNMTVYADSRLNEDSIVMEIGEYNASFNAYGYREESSTGILLYGSYPSGSVITDCFSRDSEYGMALGSPVNGELWSWYKFIKAEWKFEDGTYHEFNGTLSLSLDLGIYISPALDDELLALTKSNVGNQGTVYLTEAFPTNTIDITIGETEISTGETVYGYRAESNTGELASFDIPLAASIENAYVSTSGVGCLVGSGFNSLYLSYPEKIEVEWKFFDGTTHKFGGTLTHESGGYYSSTETDETLIGLISSRVGQPATVTLMEPVISWTLGVGHDDTDNKYGFEQSDYGSITPDKNDDGSYFSELWAQSNRSFGIYVLLMEAKDPSDVNYRFNFDGFESFDVMFQYIDWRKVYESYPVEPDVSERFFKFLEAKNGQDVNFTVEKLDTPPPSTFTYSWTAKLNPTKHLTKEARDVNPSPNQPFDGTNFADIFPFTPTKWVDNSDISQLSMDKETGVIRLGATNDSKWDGNDSIRMRTWTDTGSDQFVIDVVLNWQGTCYEGYGDVEKFLTDADGMQVRSTIYYISSSAEEK